MFWPHGLAMHHQSNSLFMADNFLSAIFMISSGVVRIFAGSNEGYLDGFGTHAWFNTPRCIAIDQQTATLFVSDCDNHAIRQIAPQGEVSTLAGSPIAGYRDGHGTAAQFQHPWGICYDESNQSILVCDYSNSKLRRVSLNGEVSTVCSVPSPVFVTIAASTILVSSSTNRIFRVTKEGGVSMLEQRGSENTKTHIEISKPRGLAFHEPSNSCFVVGNDGIHRICF